MRGKKPELASFVLIGLMLASIFAGAVSGAGVSAGGAEEDTEYITIKEAVEILNSLNVVVLDVRSQAEYESGHITGAKLMPVSELEERFDELDKGKNIIVYCGSGGRSAKAREILALHGFENVYNMLGGITAWIDAGLPIKAPPPSSTTCDSCADCTEPDLLIIAPENFTPALRPLVDHKEATEMPTQMITLEHIFSHFYGADEPEKIKRAIEHYEENYSIKYVMLVGDVDKFPVRWVTHEEPDQPETQTLYFPCDLYYADLYDADGDFNSWNSDDDEYFGEHLKIDSDSWKSNPYSVNADHADLHPDVAVGRVPASDIEEVESYVAKVIRYEYLTADADSDWFHNVLLLAGRSRDDRCDPGIHFDDTQTYLGDDFRYETYIHESYYNATLDKDRNCECAPPGNLIACSCLEGFTDDQKAIFQDADGFLWPASADFVNIGFLGWHDHTSDWGGSRINYATLVNNSDKFTLAFSDGCGDGGFAGGSPGDAGRFAPDGHDLEYIEASRDRHSLKVIFAPYWRDCDGDGKNKKYYDITDCIIDGISRGIDGDHCGGGFFPDMSFADDFDGTGLFQCDNVVKRERPYILNAPLPDPLQPDTCDREFNPEKTLFAKNSTSGVETGWVGLVAATKGAQFPGNGELESLFFRSYNEPHSTVSDRNCVGDMWRSMLEYWLEEVVFDETGNFDFIEYADKYDLDITRGGGVSGIQHTMMYALFGDPSLRVGGVEGLEDNDPPVTFCPDGEWYGGKDVIGDEIRVPLTAFDRGTPPSGVRETKYRVDNGRLRTGNHVTIEAPSDHSNDSFHRIDYYSIDFLGNEEAEKTATIGIDTYISPAATRVFLDGEPPAMVVCSCPCLCPTDNPECECECECPERGCYVDSVTVSFNATDAPPYTPPPTPTPTEEWTETFGGSNNDRAYSVQQTIDGGYIIAGWTGSYGAGGHDVLLVKTDSDGNEEWTQTFGGSGGDAGRSVQQTSDRGYIIAGDTSSYGAGSSDVWLIKTDSNGAEQWNHTFGGSSIDEAHSILQISGGYIIAGKTRSYDAGGGDVWLVKSDSNGIEQWNHTFGGSGTDEAHSIQQTTDGGYIVAGNTWSYGTGRSDVWLVKSDSNGIEQWNKTFGGSSEDSGRSVQQTTDGGYIVAGDTESYGAGNPDAWLIKTDSSGNERWNKTFGGSGWDFAYSVQQTADGGYIVAGSKEHLHDKDVWLIKTGSTGNEQWSETFGLSRDDTAYSVQQTADGAYIVAGDTESYGAGEYDAWVIKVALTTPTLTPIPVSGIDYTEYDLHGWPYLCGWPYERYTAPFPVRGGDLLGTRRTLRYWSVDNASNVELNKSVSFCVSNWKAGLIKDKIRILAALEEIIAFKMRKDFADSLPPIKSVRFEAAGPYPTGQPEWTTIGTDYNGDDGWGVMCDTNELSNGDYYVRMTAMGLVVMASAQLQQDKVIYQEQLNVTVCNIQNSSYEFNLIAPDEIDRGEAIEYTLEYVNKMDYSLTNLNMICDIDTDFFDKIKVLDDGYLSKEGRPTWFRKELKGGETWKVHFNGWTKPDIYPGTVITSQALITADTVPLLLSDDPTTPEEDDYTAVAIRLINGSITGKVEDEKYGTPIMASVAIDGPVAQSIATDEEGNYSFSNLPPGVYMVSVDAENYEYHSPAGAVTVTLDGTMESVQVDFLMRHADTIPPVSSILPSADEIVQESMTEIYGTAYDYAPGSGVRKVELSIERNNDRKYWDGDSWGDKETWLLASETTKWVLNCGGITWDSNFSYALKSRATDNAGNVERPTVITTTSTLQAPALISPANGTNVEYIPTFEWSYVLDSCYYIQIDNDSDFQSPEIDASYLTYNTYTPGEMGEGTYYWRVKAIDMERGYPESKWSEVWAVNILPSQPPDLEIVKKWESWVDKENGTYTVSYVVHNNGTTVAPAGHHTTLYIDEEAVEHKPVPVALKPFDTYEDTFKTVVKCTPPGDKITVCVDNYDKVDELDEGNNCMTNVWQCPVPVRKPDLVIKDIKLSREGNYCYVDYLISNTGTVSASASTTYLYVDDKKVASDSTGALASGASRWERFTAYRTTGAHTYEVCADGPNAISETNEANNCRTEKLRCPKLVKQDLVITKVWHKYDSKTKKTIVYYTIKNQGKGTAGASKTYMSWYPSGKLISTDDVPLLSAGQTRTESFAPYPFSTTGFDINICADGNHKIAETNEANNCKRYYTIG